MEKKSLREITQTDSYALTSIIDYWKSYDTSSILLAYAELKRRNYSIDEITTKRISEFCSSKKGVEIETLLSSALNEIGYETYEECYEKEIVARRMQQQDGKIDIGFSKNENKSNNNSAGVVALYVLGGLLIIPGLYQFYNASQIVQYENSIFGAAVKEAIEQKNQFGALLTIGGFVLLIIGFIISQKPSSNS